LVGAGGPPAQEQRSDHDVEDHIPPTGAPPTSGGAVPETGCAEWPPPI
jgi:hypothetical protein